MLKSKKEMFVALEKIVQKYDDNENIIVITKDDKATVFNVDMINDFVYTSLMKNPLAEKIIPKIVNFLNKAKKFGCEVNHINEAHTENSLELETFAKHGIKGTQGARIVDPIRAIPYNQIFYKNSTNGFHNEKVKEWLDKHPETNVVVITGVLTDMCVFQFAISLKTYCNQINRNMRVIIPYDLVETSDYEGHNRDLFYYVSLEMMAQAGIEVVKNVDFN